MQLSISAHLVGVSYSLYVFCVGVSTSAQLSTSVQLSTLQLCRSHTLRFRRSTVPRPKSRWRKKLFHCWRLSLPTRHSSRSFIDTSRELFPCKNPERSSRPGCSLHFLRSAPSCPGDPVLNLALEKGPRQPRRTRATANQEARLFAQGVRTLQLVWFSAGGRAPQLAWFVGRSIHRSIPLSLFWSALPSTFV